MRIHTDSYTPIDKTEGLWLDIERDDLGSTRHWMTIEGEEIELTEKQFYAFMKHREEARKASIEAERERIITLLSGYVCHLDDCIHNGCNNLRFAIELVKGEQK